MYSAYCLESELFLEAIYSFIEQFMMQAVITLKYPLRPSSLPILIKVAPTPENFGFFT